MVFLAPKNMSTNDKIKVQKSVSCNTKMIVIHLSRSLGKAYCVQKCKKMGIENLVIVALELCWCFSVILLLLAWKVNFDYCVLQNIRTSNNLLSNISHIIKSNYWGLQQCTVQEKIYCKYSFVQCFLKMCFFGTNARDSWWMSGWVSLYHRVINCFFCV